LCFFAIAVLLGGKAILRVGPLHWGWTSRHIEAIERGIITPTTKQRLEELEAEKASLEALPVEAALPTVHPNLAQLYRHKVARLEEELADPEIAAETRSVLRSLIKTIKVTPGAKWVSMPEADVSPASELTNR